MRETTEPPRSPSGRSLTPLVAGIVGLLLLVGLVAFFVWRQSTSVVAEKPGQIEAAAPVPPAPPPSPAAALAEPDPPTLERLVPTLASRFGPVERDTFDNPATGLFSNPPPTPNGRVAYDNGTLIMEYSRKALSDPFGIGEFASRPVAFTNGGVEVEVWQQVGPDTASAAIQLRRTSGTQNGYFVALLPQRRQVVLSKAVGAERTEIARSQSPGIQPDGWNRLVVIADGPEFQVLVNGQPSLIGRDETYISGRVGLGVYLGGGTDLGDVRFAVNDLRVVQFR